MDYTTIHWLPNQPGERVDVTLELSPAEWLALENSVHWAGIEKFIDDLRSKANFK